MRSSFECNCASHRVGVLVVPGAVHAGTIPWLREHHSDVIVCTANDAARKRGCISGPKHRPGASEFRFRCPLLSWARPFSAWQPSSVTVGRLADVAIERPRQRVAALNRVCIATYRLQRRRPRRRRAFRPVMTKGLENCDYTSCEEKGRLAQLCGGQGRLDENRSFCRPWCEAPLQQPTQ